MPPLSQNMQDTRAKVQNVNLTGVKAVTFYVVREKNTDRYIPQPEGRQGRGGSFTEPTPFLDNIRLFRTQKQARAFLSMWLKGRLHGEFDYEEGVRYTYGYRVQPVATRKRENMEVVPVTLLLQDL